MSRLSALYRLDEDAIDDRGVQMRISRGENPGTFDARLSSAGSPIGVIMMARDQRKMLIRIEGSTVEPRWQRKGLGQAAYVRLNAWAARQGCRLASDLVRSRQAEGLWQKLAALGLADRTHDAEAEADIYVMRPAATPPGEVPS